MAAQPTLFVDHSAVIDALTRDAQSFTQISLDKRRSAPARRMARRRAQLLTYAATAMLRFEWTFDNEA